MEHLKNYKAMKAPSHDDFLFSQPMPVNLPPTQESIKSQATSQEDYYSRNMPTAAHSVQQHQQTSPYPKNFGLPTISQTLNL
jgi:hypothetical protein